MASQYTRLRNAVAKALEADDRPVVAVVGFDPALRGDCGLAVWPLKRVRGFVTGTDVRPAYWHGNVLTAGATKWLGDQVSSVCVPGERVLLMTENTAYGQRVARQLGISIGVVEGLLVDLNAMTPNTRVDVAAQTWRGRAGVKTAPGRSLKEAAINVASDWVHCTATGMDHNAAEALCIAYVGVQYVKELQA